MRGPAGISKKERQSARRISLTTVANAMKMVVNNEALPEYFPYSEGRQNKQEPRDLQRCTVLHQ